MRKAMIIIFLLILLIALFSVHVFAVDTTQISQLIDNGKTFDNRQVIIEGEAIGEVLQRNDYSWVNIKDGTNAIGVWMNTADAQKITQYGNYKFKGDTIRITGVFYRACIKHGGEADIHCMALTIVKKGYPLSVVISNTKIIVACSLLLALLAAFMTAYFLMIRKNSTKR